MPTEPFTLESLDAALHAQFRDVVEKVVEALDTSGAMATRYRKARIVLALDFSHDAETGNTVVESSLTAKMPKYRPVSQAVEIDAGRMVVDRSQMAMFDDAEVQ